MGPQLLRRKETPERTRRARGSAWRSVPADELFEFEREVGAGSPGGHGAVTL